MIYISKAKSTRGKLCLASQIKHKTADGEIFVCWIEDNGREIGDPVRVQLKDLQEADMKTIYALPNLTTEEMAEHTGLTAGGLRSQIAHGSIYTYKRAGGTFIPMPEVIRYERENQA